MLPGSLPITDPRLRQKRTRSQGPSLRRHYPAFHSTLTLSDSRVSRRHLRRWRRNLRPQRVSPDYPNHPSGVPCPLPRRIETVLVSVASGRARPSPFLRRVGVRKFTFEACSGFTHVTARRIARPPKAAFVARLQPGKLAPKPLASYQIKPTTIWVEPSSTGNPRLRGALRNTG